MAQNRCLNFKLMVLLKVQMNQLRKDIRYQSVVIYMQQYYSHLRLEILELPQEPW
jgi:hypothetical protein